MQQSFVLCSNNATNRIREVKRERELFCANAGPDTITLSGAWCLEPFNNISDPFQVESKKDWEQFQEREPQVSAHIVPRLGSQHHVPPDVSFGKGMIHLLEHFADHCTPLSQPTNASVAPSSNRIITVVDVGAGIGQYGAVLEANSERISWRGYDGAGNVENFTHGRVQWFDATDAALDSIDGIADWVISLEIAEHIPVNATDAFVDLLARHSRYGVLLSWATPGQGGHGHINCMNERRVRYWMSFSGLQQGNWSMTFQAKVRSSVTSSYWFKHTFYVFRKPSALAHCL